MEDNLNNQPEEITNDILDEGIDIDLDQDYVIDWDKNWEEDAVQIGETEEVSLGEGAGDSEEVDGGLRVESDQEADAYEGEGEEAGDVGLGEVYYEDDEDDPRYEQEESEYDDDYEDDEDDDYEDDEVDSPFAGDEEWEKLYDFLKEYPGSTPADYVRMTNGGEGLSDDEILKIHLASENGLDVEEDAEELEFLLEDKFGYDEELDSERDIKLKKLEAKKALRSAKSNLSEMQLKYGADLKFGSESPELKELQSFQEQQLEIQQQQQELSKGFQDATADYFSKEFKGFEFEYGDGRKQRIKANPNKTAEFQSDISNFIGKYMGEDGTITDMAGYHKALWAASNADALFSHAYEQGKADAVRSSAKNAKNIDMGPRSDRGAESETGSSGFRIVDEGSHTENFSFNLTDY